MRTWALLLTFLLIGQPLFSQENCANGIDDDGDGLVDLNDKSDCSCALPSTLTSLLPNPSLEEFDGLQSGCASQQPGGRPDAVNQANCLTGWQRVSMGTTDSWNAFTFTNAGPYFPSKLPLPLPSGTGVGGFWVGVRDTPDSRFLNGDGSTAQRYREYLAAGFVDGQRLEADADYRLTFHLGFMEPQIASEDAVEVSVASPSDVELSVYGVRERHQLHFGSYYDCPETAGAEGYELIGNVTVSGTPGRWTPVELDFVAAKDYAGFAIGGSCAPDHGRPGNGNYRNYYFIDDLILNRTEAFAGFAAGPVSVHGLTVCDASITLSGTAHAGATYQWYRNGVALVGATSRVLQLAGGPEVDGSYVLRVTAAGGCALTDEVVIQRPVQTDHFEDTVAFCGDLSEVRLRPRRFTGATYRWDDGSTTPDRVVTEAGTYTVTVSETCVEHVERIVVAENAPFTYSLSTSPERACAGDTVAVRFRTSAPGTRVYFRSLETGASLTPADGALTLIAGETEGVLVFMSNDCGTHTDTVRVPVAKRFVIADSSVTDLYCGTGTGRIAVTLASPAGARYAWTDGAGRSVGGNGPVLETTEAGTYTLTVSGSGYCTESFSFTVADQRSFTADIRVQAPACSAGGAIAVEGITGNYPYTVAWYKDGKAQRLEGAPTALSDLPSGRYAVVITDATGCTVEETVALEGPAPLSARVDSGYDDCDDHTSGFISLTGNGGTLPYSYVVAGKPAQLDTDFTGLAAGTYEAWIEDAAGCRSPSVAVTLHELSLPEIDLGPDRFIRMGDTVRLNAGRLDLTNGNSLSWNNAGSLDCADCAAPVAAPVTTTAYAVTYTTPDYCQITDSVTVYVDRSPRIYVPNAFSPNGDDHNDVFRIFIPNGMAVLTDLMIFDRWGELLWEKDARRDGAWDGTYRGKPLPAGVYVYAAEVRLADDSVVPLKGSVTLVR